MKHIVICCDGTWNTPDKQEGGVPVATNVVKLAEAVEPEAENRVQLMYYDPGVGTSGSWLKRLWDGATGSGLQRNLLEAYRWLIHNYEPSDKLFFFGFSRGAFTVRSLAGLVRNSGILERDSLHMLDQAFALYRARTDRTHPRGREATLFRRTYAVEDVTPIEFIGVWDTVGALGNPLLFNRLSPGNRFHDTDLSSKIRHAYQALAIDEQRRFFKATLWTAQPEMSDQTLEQVWFAGVHSNVGGGIARTGLSDLALQWLTDKARAVGLGIRPVEGDPDAFERLAKSRTALYRLFPRWFRPIGKPEGKNPTNESVHDAVFERYRADASYRPRNLEEYLGRNPGLRPGT